MLKMQMCFPVSSHRQRNDISIALLKCVYKFEHVPQVSDMTMGLLFTLMLKFKL